MRVNRSLPALLPMLALLAACGQAPRTPATNDRADSRALSCAELADRKAARQHASDSASLDEREGGADEASALSRDLIGMEAAAYREQVYRECLRLRGLPPAEGN